MKSKLKPLRILKVWSTFQTEIKYHDHYLADVMKKNGHETVFFASDCIEPAWKPFLKNKSFAFKESWNGHIIYRFASKSIANKPFLKKPFKFIRAIKNYKPDIIHILGLAYPVNQLALIASLILRKTPVFVNDHGIISEERKGILARIFYLNSFLIYSIYKKIKNLNKPIQETKFIEQMKNQEKLKKNINLND